jgi:uncharacterized repeat protein (TIGR01451 family)
MFELVKERLMGTRSHAARKLCLAVSLIPPLLLLQPSVAHAAGGLSVTLITWDTIGLDSNDVTVGPNHFPVGARVCNTSGAPASNIQANFVWDSANAYINLRPGTNSSLTFAGPLANGACTDFYFEVEVTRTPAAYNTTRNYEIDVTANGGLTGASPTPRQLFVEHLISQSRNAVLDMQFRPSGVGAYQSVPNGGGMTLLLGGTYDIKLVATTATQGYEQLESFINFPNTIFQIQSVSTTYSADTSTYVSNPNDKLYADSCSWDANPLTLNYRACNDVGKAGGNITVTYTVKILSVPGAPLVNPEPLSTLIHDFSGSSFHYNSDFGTSVRFAYILDPAAIPITKSFVPDTIAAGATSTLTLRIPNPSPNALTGVNFIDPLPTSPAAMTVAGTPNPTTSGCGTPTFAPNAGDASLAFSQGTIPANSTCVITVNVTVPASPATGSYVNTTLHLFINGTTPGTGIDTGNTGTATLTVNSGAVICVAGTTMAQWTVPTNLGGDFPPDAAGGVPTTKAANVSTATASDTHAGDQSTATAGVTTQAWLTWGYKTDANTLQFVLQTKNYSNVAMTWSWNNQSPSNGPSTGQITSSAGGSIVGGVMTPPGAAGWTAGPTISTLTTSTTGTTTFTLAFSGANNNNSSGGLAFDNITFTGCSFSPPPAITKAFSPAQIVVNNTSALTFTITNPGTAAYDPVPLTGVQFSDTLPAGLVVATPNGASTTCTGGTVTAAAGGTSIALTGASMTAAGSCTVTVNVQGNTPGAFQNVSGRITSTQSGPNNTSTGQAIANLTVVAPPSISKAFGAATIQQNGSTSLSFTITNPNVGTTLTGVGVTDNLPAGLVVATPNGLSGTCGGSTPSAVAGSSVVSVSGATLAALASCTFSVNVTGTTAGTKVNTTGAVTSSAGNGNTATATVVVEPPHPSISLLKQVSTSATGPWTTFLAVTLPASVYYQFTIENTGDVPLSPVSVSDPQVDTSFCTWPATLPVATALPPGNTNHIATCVVGPVTAVAGLKVNTATASGTYAPTGTTVTDTSTARYSTTGLTLVKFATETSFSAAGDLIHYSFGVTNTGTVALAGPVTVSDTKLVGGFATCPAVSTVGNGDGNLDPGESITCTGTYTVTATDVTNGSVTNVAQATAASVTSNTATKTVPKATVLSVSKDDGVTTVQSGGTTTYTIIVTNNGPGTPTPTLTDPAVAGLTKTAIGTCSAFGGATCPSAANLTIANLQGAGVVMPAAMPVGSSIVFTITATVTATSGSLTNTFTTNVGGVLTSASDTDTLAQNFGHLPVPPYPANTDLQASGGAYHLTGATYLGATVPVEADGGTPAGQNPTQFDLEAADDGVTLNTATPWTAGGTGKVNVTYVCPSGCVLEGWLDWGNDGSLTTAGDQIISNQVFAAGSATTTLTFNIPVGVNFVGTQYFYARFRIYQGGIPDNPTSPTGQATAAGTPTIGEVEDYLFGLTGGVATRAVVSSFLARDHRGEVVIEWQTSAETGTVGYFLRRFDEHERQYVAVNERLLPALLTSQHGGVYRCVDEQARTGVNYKYQLVEVEASGKRNTYGPYTVNTFASASIPDAVVGPKGFASHPSTPGFEMAPRPGSDRDASARKLGPATVAPGWSRGTTATAQAAKIGVPTSGLYYVSFRDLQTKGGLTIANPNRNALTNRGAPVAFTVTGDQSGILFYGQKSSSLYERENVYRLASTGTATGMKVQRPFVRVRPRGDETFVKTLHMEQNVFDAPNIFSDPSADFWMWDWIFAGDGSKAFTFRADGVVRAGSASMTIHLKGATDTPAVPDHHAVFNLNGQQIGEVFWNGLDAVQPTLTFDPGLLVDGENTLEIVGMTDTLAPYSIFYLDSFDVSYASRYRAYGNKVEAPAGGNASILVSGFTRPDIMVFDITDPGSPIYVQAGSLATADGTYGVALSPPTPTTVYYVVTPDAVSTASTIVTDAPSALKSTANRGEYLIVTSAALKDTAQVLAHYRGDLPSQVVDIEDVYDEFSFGIQDPRALKAFLTWAHANWAVPPRYVVLAGDGTYDYRDNLGLGGNLIPPLLSGTPDGLFTSDTAFGDVSGGPAPEIAIGRLPVSNAAELEAIIRKIQARESALGSPWLNRLLLVSDNADAGGDFPAANESIARLAPAGSPVDRIDLTVLGIDAARSAFFGDINQGAGMVSYFGHGGFDILADEGLFHNGDVSLFTNSSAPTVVTAMTCLVANPSLPGYPSVGEVLVRQDTGGAAAVWAPSGLSKHELAVPLAQGFYAAAYGAAGSRIGDVVLSSMTAYEKSGRPGYMLTMFTLLGDPAMKLR